MNRIYPLDKSLKKLEIEQVEDIIGLLNRVSLNSKRSINGLKSQLKLTKKGTPRATEVQNRINLELQKWSDKVKRMGVTPLGLYRCRIATPDKNYLWEFPNKKPETL